MSPPRGVDEEEGQGLLAGKGSFATSSAKFDCLTQQEQKSHAKTERAAQVMRAARPAARLQTVDVMNLRDDKDQVGSRQR